MRTRAELTVFPTRLNPLGTALRRAACMQSTSSSHRRITAARLPSESTGPCRPSVGFQATR